MVGPPKTTFADLAAVLGIPEKRKIFISYHHHGDQAYKNYLSNVYCEQYELLEDNSLDRMIDTDNLEYVEREIREDYIRGASVTIVLCGAQTYLRKFVDWEIYATLRKQAGLVAVQLPTLAPTSLLSSNVNVPARLSDNIKSGYAVWRSWNDLVATPGSLRLWIEEALAKDKSLIDNSRLKMQRNA